MGRPEDLGPTIVIKIKITVTSAGSSWPMQARRILGALSIYQGKDLGSPREHQILRTSSDRSSTTHPATESQIQYYPSSESCMRLDQPHFSPCTLVSSFDFNSALHDVSPTQLLHDGSILLGTRKLFPKETSKSPKAQARKCPIRGYV